jgi:hypothetical protein
MLIVEMIDSKTKLKITSGSDQQALEPNFRLKTKHYTATELNALCNFDTPMPADLQSWDRMKDVGREALPNA